MSGTTEIDATQADESCPVCGSRLYVEEAFTIDAFHEEWVYGCTGCGRWFVQVVSDEGASELRGQ